MANEIALAALDRILAAEYNLLEIYQRLQTEEPELSPLFEKHYKLCQEMTGELVQLVTDFGVSPRQSSGLIGTVFRLGESIGNSSWSNAAVARQIKLAMEEKYRLLSRLPPKGLAIVERHLGQERQMLLELEQLSPPALV